MEKGLIVLFGLTMLYFASTSRIHSHIKLLFWQGIFLFLICCFKFSELEILNFLFLTLETLGVKAILIPLFLQKTLNRHAYLRDEVPGKPQFFSLILASIFLLLGVLSHHWVSALEIVSPIHFGISISGIIISLWLMTVKHNVVSSVICFITMENSIFLLSLSIANEMPILVNLGVLLDVFIDVFILGLFINLIKKEFKDLDVSKLSELKDFEND